MFLTVAFKNDHEVKLSCGYVKGNGEKERYGLKRLWEAQGYILHCHRLWDTMPTEEMLRQWFFAHCSELFRKDRDTVKA